MAKKNAHPGRSSAMIRAMRSIVVVSRTARADAAVRLDDLPGTSGRLDVVARSVRAALCVSHGIRKDARVYLVLLGGTAPRTIRIDGATAKFVRPDERALATTILKAVARVEVEDPRFVEQRLGVAVACAGLDAALDDVRGQRLFVLEEDGADVRDEPVGEGAFVVGDHTGFDDEIRARLASAGARPIRVGPTSLHTDDAIAVLHAELDRAALG